MSRRLNIWKKCSTNTSLSGQRSKKIFVSFDLYDFSFFENFNALNSFVGAQQFSELANFEEIPLPIGAPEATKSPFASLIGPQAPTQLQAAMRAGILKKQTTVGQRRHKHPPG